MIDLSERYPREFYQQSTLLVCRNLLGSVLVHRSPEGVTAARIVEAEAYVGPKDKGAHSFGGRPTDRTRAMFGEKGHAYVFLIYGMYWCFNVVCGPPGMPQAVLVRALEPVVGEDLMRARLNAKEAVSTATLCKGPGKLCRAMGISREHYGLDLLQDTLFLVPAKLRRGEKVVRSPRINIDYAEEFIERPWRYFIKDHPSVSASRKHL